MSYHICWINVIVYRTYTYKLDQILLSTQYNWVERGEEECILSILQKGYRKDNKGLIKTENVFEMPLN